MFTSCCEDDKLKISFTGHDPREDAVAALDLLKFFRKTVIDQYPVRGGGFCGGRGGDRGGRGGFGGRGGGGPDRRGGFGDRRGGDNRHRPY